MSYQQPPIDDIVGQYQTVYDVYFSQADSTGSGAIGALDAAAFLKQSKLKDPLLKEIWELADPTGKGYLDRNAFYITLKLIAACQAGHELKIENLSLPTPAPKLGELSSNIPTLIAPDDAWYIKASSRLSFDKLFDSLSPINNKITGARVKPFLMSTSLPVDVLGKIWELSDLDQDGQLDRDEFLIAMQLVNKAKEGATIPDQLPPSLLPFKVGHSNMPTVPGAFIMPGQTGPMMAAFPISMINEMKPWVVSVEEKAKSDIVFNQLDTDKDGFVTGTEVKDVFLATGLSAMILANIWNLCDIGTTGKLNCEQYALAMHFINKKLATGLDAPMELLPEMIPPTLRPKPAHSEDMHVSKELEELQTQVTELQREKLFYDQRASEHDMATRQKRTELSNLELEMESLHKAQQEREMKKNEEQKRLADYEDKITKLDSQLVDLKQKYESEQDGIEKLKLQIQHMETAMKSKDNDLTKIKTDLQTAGNEQANLEARLSSRKANLAELTSSLSSVNFEVDKSKSKVELLKTIQANLNRLLKEYDNVQVNSSLNEEIKRLEEENLKLNQEIRTIMAQQEAAVVNGNDANVAAAATFSPSFSQTSFNAASNLANTSSISSNSNTLNGGVGGGGFDAFFSPTGQPMAQAGFTMEDPFQAFDPFKDSNSDPFKTETGLNGTKSPVNVPDDDPFANAFDPFKTAAVATNGAANGFGADDPFGDKKRPPPPRPAPPRPQTPSLKPVKNANDAAQRSQSSLDFTRNNKLDLFSDFPSDPFQSTAPAPASSAAPAKDPFGGGGFDWSAFSTGSSAATPAASSTSAKDPFDPFA